MGRRLLAIAINGETDIVLARQRTRVIADALGFDGQDQTRITTAVSELVRNVLEYAREGRIEYWLTDASSLKIVVVDQGPGIKDLDAILEGRHQSTTGMGIGLVGARRLMDDFAISTAPGEGTTITLIKNFPPQNLVQTNTALKRVSDALAQQDRVDPVVEVRRQNQEMLLQLGELAKHQAELENLNQELSDTNRGVVALYAELEERAEHLRRADDLKTRFLSNMSHEFRTPLNSILSLSRLLLSGIDGKLGGEHEKQVQFIRYAAENLTELVNDLLDLARVEAGKTVVTVKAFSVDDLFGALRGMLRPILVTEHVELIFEDATDMPQLMSDEGKISQILRNFISNAIKFTEHGEIRVWSVFDTDTEEVTFHVKDTGVGIPAQDMTVIWEEFGQAQNKLQSRVKGTGLGLPLTRKLAELLGGSVGAESAPVVGSRFWLKVPYNISRTPAAAKRTWTIEPGRLPVLVVEDNAADVFTLERCLANSSYQPMVAATIAEAQDALSEIGAAAIILDVLLENEESWRFLIELKQNVKTNHIPVIVVSTSPQERKARSFGADEYLDKPVDTSAVIEVLDRLTDNESVTNVLLIDDEEISRYLIRQLMPRGTFKLVEAPSAAAGIAVAESAPPHVIVLDINMPEVDGFTALDMLSRHPRLAGIPVIVATSMILSEAQRASLKHAASIVSKFDLTTETLVAAIRDVVSNTREAA